MQCNAIQYNANNPNARTDYGLPPFAVATRPVAGRIAERCRPSGTDRDAKIAVAAICGRNEAARTDDTTRHDTTRHDTEA